MADYRGCKCPVCRQPFTEQDDLVVCPECGAPYHRECYHKNAGCLFADRHGAGFEWKPAPGEGSQPESTGPERACPACGAMNPAGGLFCESCGVPLNGPARGAAPQYGPQSAPQYGPQYGPRSAPNRAPFVAPMQGGAAVSPEEELDGIKARDWAAFLGPNALFYLMHFKRMALTGQKLAVSFAAFFFGPFYFFYRKMWVPAAVFLVLDIFGAYIPQLLQFMVLAESPLVAGLDQNLFAAVLNVLRIVNLAVQFSQGLFAVYWYRRIAKKRIRQVLDSCSAAEMPAALAGAGGVSVVALVISLTLVLGIYMAVSFAALAPLMAQPLAGLAV